MANHLPVMILAIMLAVGVMMFAAKPIGDFVDTHPTLKILALAFLILVGVSLIAESLDIHIPKGYIYFADVYKRQVLGGLYFLSQAQTKNTPLKSRFQVQCLLVEDKAIFLIPP